MLPYLFLSERVSENSIDKLCTIERVLLKSINAQTPSRVASTDQLQDLPGMCDIINIDSIKTELRLLSNAKDTYNCITNVNLKTVSCVRTIVDIMKGIAGHKLFPQIDKLYRL